jgi:hypothetical protein
MAALIARIASSHIVIWIALQDTLLTANSVSYVHLPQKQLFFRNGPVAASPCKGMDQWQLTNPAKGEFASKKCSNMF